MSMARPPVKLLADPGHLLSFGFGSGYAPKAPGTAGTLAAIPFFLGLSLLNPITYALVTLGCLFIGIYLCQRTSEALGVADHPAIVWDEFVGYFITMLLAPVNVYTVVLGFIFFRFFDILKPWPVSVIDSRLKGGLGVMLDDVIAGVYAFLCLQVCIRLFDL